MSQKEKDKATEEKEVYLPEYPFIPEKPIVEKMQELVKTKQEEILEKERLANMPKQPYIREEPRVGRNDPCPCGSGKKYKKCCLLKEQG